jgi:hypothetical protein
MKHSKITKDSREHVLYINRRRNASTFTYSHHLKCEQRIFELKKPKNRRGFPKNRQKSKNSLKFNFQARNQDYIQSQAYQAKNHKFNVFSVNVRQ